MNFTKLFDELGKKRHALITVDGVDEPAVVLTEKEFTHAAHQVALAVIEEVRSLRLCTKTGIHTCRLGSIHVNERGKQMFEDHLTDLEAKLKDV